MCVLVFLKLVIPPSSRALTRTLFMVDLLSVVKCLLLCLKNKKKIFLLKEKITTVIISCSFIFSEHLACFIFSPFVNRHSGQLENWTVHSEACLRSFNFVCNKECSCGQLVNRHFCKTWTEPQPPFSVKLSKSSEKHLLLKMQSGFNKGTCHEVVTATLEIKNHRLSYTAGSNNGAGRLTEALCLEARTPRYEIESKNLPLKALNEKRNLPSSHLIKGACTVNPFHRRSHSLDLNIRERLVLSPVLYETYSMATLYHGQNKNPPAYIQGSLQLESNRKYGSSFQDLYSSSADILQNKFQVISITKLLHRETESECDFEVTGQSSGSIIADGSPLVINLPSPTWAVEDKQYITLGGLVQPTSIFSNQKLSKRERNKSQNLRRKQSRREQCLQKQVSVKINYATFLLKFDLLLEIILFFFLKLSFNTGLMWNCIKSAIRQAKIYDPFLHVVFFLNSIVSGFFPVQNQNMMGFHWPSYCFVM